MCFEQTLSFRECRIPWKEASPLQENLLTKINHQNSMKTLQIPTEGIPGGYSIVYAYSVLVCVYIYI